MTTHVNSISELNPFFEKGSSLYLSGCAAEIPGFNELEAFRSRTLPLLISGVFIPGVNRQDYTSLGDQVVWQTYFMSPGLARNKDRLRYCPWRYRDILAFYQQQATDIAMVMVSEPDQQGYCSYGVSADFSPVVMQQAGVKIGIINRQMPFTLGVRGPHVSEFDAIVEIDQPLIEVPATTGVDEDTAAIASHVANFISDGATLQFGLGKIPSTVIAEITDRKNLKLVSGLLDDSMVELERTGAMSVEQPARVGVALGCQRFYQELAGNERFHFMPVSETHNLATLSVTPNLVAVNGALEVDLMGQVNSCVTPRGYLSGPGGLPEFANAALSSPGGRSIIALPATVGKNKISKIVPAITGGMPSISSVDADVVVTEYGVAELRGKSLSQRIQAMIAIAAPEHRDELLKQSLNLI